ncbi:anti-sigma factor RsiW [Streptacidiphilus sp. MAP12-16]|uniref:zf-HC2 domain-containing protein n=1 Tax=Streptacidiphilus sp. MAP12-16 TaxID=3156300 RepID=UPI0035122EBF
MTEQSRRARPQEVVVELRVARSAVAPVAPAAEDHHLGDRLAAFVDGELDHDARERVQSHLATCSACLTRAEDERRVKSRLAAAAPPDPSAVFLSRLVSIAADRDEQPPAGPPARRGFAGAAFGSAGTGFGSGGFGNARFGSGALGADHPVPGVDPRAERGMPFQGELRPIAARLWAGIGPSDGRPQGFPEAERGQRVEQQIVNRPSAARGRRFAFAAAGAFSVAAVALGSAITGVTAAEPSVDEPYGNVAPVADATSTSATGGAGSAGSRSNGQLAFGVPANVPGAVSPYGAGPLLRSPVGPAAPGSSATATSLPAAPYPAAGHSLLR